MILDLGGGVEMTIEKGRNIMSSRRRNYKIRNTIMDENVNEEELEEELDDDCPYCLGTGIGWNHESNSCGHCKGRGYQLPTREDYDPD